MEEPATPPPPDPWAFQRWAFSMRVGNPVRKAVLSMLASMAGSESGRCEAKQATIAYGVEAGERAIRGHLRWLEEHGIIARRPQRRIDGSRRGDEFLLLAPWVAAWPDGEEANRHEMPPDPTGTDQPEQPAQIDPAVTASSTNGHAKASEARADAFPDDLPDELHDAAIAAGRILKRVALERGQTKAVTRLTVGHAVLTYDDRDHVKVAREVEAWVLHGNGARRSCRDVVARYRNFLANAEPRPGPPIPGSAAPRGGPSTGSAKLRAMAAELRTDPKP